MGSVFILHMVFKRYQKSTDAQTFHTAWEIFAIAAAVGRGRWRHGCSDGGRGANDVAALPVRLKDIFHEYANDFAKKVNDMAGNRLKIEVLPGGEIVPALDRGLIDGAEFNNASSDRILGFPDVVKNCMLQSFHQSGEQFEILFNRTKYDALPAELKSIIDYAVQAASADRSCKAAHRHSQDYLDAGQPARLCRTRRRLVERRHGRLQDGVEPLLPPPGRQTGLMRREPWFGFSLMGLMMLALVVVAIMRGFPTAFTLMGMGIIFTFFAYHSGGQSAAGAVKQTLDLMVQRAFSAMSNDVLISIPLFVLHRLSGRARQPDRKAVQEPAPVDGACTGVAGGGAVVRRGLRPRPDARRAVRGVYVIVLAKLRPHTMPPLPAEQRIVPLPPLTARLAHPDPGHRAAVSAPGHRAVAAQGAVRLSPAPAGRAAVGSARVLG